jgi:hypothetical protein
MAAIVGYNGSVKLGATGGTDVVANIQNWELPLAADQYDVSVLGLGWKQYLPGLNGAVGKASSFFDTSDTSGQVALMNAQLNGTLLTINLYVDDTHYFSGSAYVSQLDIKDPVNNVITADYTLQFTGAITYS